MGKVTQLAALGNWPLDTFHGDMCETVSRQCWRSGARESLSGESREDRK